jgi:hypothetical protein
MTLPIWCVISCDKIVSTDWHNPDCSPCFLNVKAVDKIHWTTKFLNPVFGFCTEVLQFVLFPNRKNREAREQKFIFLFMIQTRVSVTQRVLSHRNLILLFGSACSTFINLQHLSPRKCAHILASPLECCKVFSTDGVRLIVVCRTASVLCSYERMIYDYATTLWTWKCSCY